jgi:hypothetical protein
MSRPSAAVVVLLALSPIIVVHAWWAQMDKIADAAAQAAVQQYESRTRSTDVQIFLVSTWRGCAIVELYGSGQQFDAHIVMKQVNGQWMTALSTEDPEVSFDSDDVGSRHECLLLADSSGPISNGASVDSLGITGRASGFE